MTSAVKVPSAVSSRYAGALIDLAEEGKSLEKVEKDLQDLDAMIEGSEDLKHLIRSPMINADKRHAALQALADKAKFQDITKKFLGVLSANNRVQALEAIIQAFYKELSTRRGEVSVDIRVAQDMTAKQKKDLQAAISKGLGAEIVMNVHVEPAILGGMVVTVGSQMIDDSVARKLERLKAQMNKQSNQNAPVALEEVS